MWWTLAATCPPTGCRLGPRKNRVENGSAGRDSTRFVAAPRRWAAGSLPRDYAAGRSYGPGGRCVRAGPHGARHAARRLPGRQSYIAAIGIAEDRTGSPAENVGEAQPSTVFCIGRFIEAANWSIGHGIVHSVKEGYYAIFL